MITFGSQLDTLFAPYRRHSASASDEQRKILTSELKATFIDWFSDLNLTITADNLYRQLTRCVHADRGISDLKINGKVILKAELLSEIDNFLKPESLCGLIIEAYKSTQKAPAGPSFKNSSKYSTKYSSFGLMPEQ